MRPLRVGVWLAALAALFAGAVTALAYTTGQAQAGQQAFNICAGCHGANLQGAMGPALVGPGFQATWRNALALWSFVSQNMPLGSPGSLAKAQYWDIVAFLLQRNGVEPDDRPLNAETAEQVRLAQPAGGQR